LPSPDALGLQVRQQLVIPLVLRHGLSLADPVAAEFGEGFGGDLVFRDSRLPGQGREVLGGLPVEAHPEIAVTRGRRCRRYLLYSPLVYSVVTWRDRL